MILMSKYKGQHGGKNGQKIRAWPPPPPPFSGNARKKSIFVMGGVPSYLSIPQLMAAWRQTLQVKYMYLYVFSFSTH